MANGISILIVKLILLVLITPSISLSDHYDTSERFPVHRAKVNFRASGSMIGPGELSHHVFMYKLVNSMSGLYRAFCAGSIISEVKVLSTAHCFYTNKKKEKRPFSRVRLVAGILVTVAREATHHGERQWRRIQHVLTQKLFRYPAYNLAIVTVNSKWNVNRYVSPIPYATMNQEFDGKCKGVIVKATTSWSLNKTLFVADVHMLPRGPCEDQLLRSTEQYHCSEFIEIPALYSMGAEGAGLVCYETNDPAEIDTDQGVLVGVTTLLHKNMPSLHMRVGKFHRWIANGAKTFSCFCFCVSCVGVLLQFLV